MNFAQALTQLILLVNVYTLTYSVPKLAVEIRFDKIISEMKASFDILTMSAT